MGLPPISRETETQSRGRGVPRDRRLVGRQSNAAPARQTEFRRRLTAKPGIDDAHDLVRG
jgi:hypothetical protein